MNTLLISNEIASGLESGHPIVAVESTLISHGLPYPENMNVASSIDGGTSFMRIDTRDGRKSVFDVISAVQNSITNTNKFKSLASGTAEAQIKIVADRDPNPWKFNLEGSLGSVTISTTVANNSYTDLVSQINQNTGNTGIVATLDTKTGDEIIEIFKELSESGITVIIITHDNAVAKKTSRIIEMKDGMVQ